MNNTEKARELINKHLYIHGGDTLGITDGNVYRAVLDAVCEALDTQNDELVEFARNNCREWNTEELYEILDKLII